MCIYIYIYIHTLITTTIIILILLLLLLIIIIIRRTSLCRHTCINADARTSSRLAPAVAAASRSKGPCSVES